MTTANLCISTKNYPFKNSQIFHKNGSPRAKKHIFLQSHNRLKIATIGSPFSSTAFEDSLVVTISFITFVTSPVEAGFWTEFVTNASSWRFFVQLPHALILRFLFLSLGIQSISIRILLAFHNNLLIVGLDELFQVKKHNIFCAYFCTSFTP